MKPELLKNCLFLAGLEAFSDSAERKAPESFLVLKYGKTQYTKGNERGEYEFSPEDADRVLADFETRKRDIVIDYEHQTLSGKEAPAAGWIDRIEKTAEGIAVHVKYWTEKALNHLREGEYRYFSPVFHESRRRPLALHSVAMTNHPATHGIPALVMADEPEESEEPKEKVMDENLKQIAEKLGLSIVALADGGMDVKTMLKQCLEKLEEMLNGLYGMKSFLALHDAKDLDAVTGKIKGMVPAAELTALNDRLAGIEAEKAVQKAFSDRKLVEAQRGWAMAYAKKDLQAFSDFVAAAPAVAPASAATVPVVPDGKAAPELVVLSDDELKVYRKAGMTDKDIEQIKADKAKEKKG
jgi:phage I-like protein